MKRLFGLLIFFQLSAFGWSQTMTIDFKDGFSQKYNMKDIEAITFSQSEDSIQEQDNHPTDENVKDIYSNLSLYNVEREACRCRYIRWTALSPIPENTGANAFYKAGNMTGIPYTSAMEIDKMVGFDISYTSFMTAANNPYSMLYTENIRDNGSVYGFTYAHPARGTVAGWAGMVCNILPTLCTGMKIPYDTGMFAYLASKGDFVKVYPQNAQGVRIGDILWQSGHAMLIQNVWRGDNGEVTRIEVSHGGWYTPETYEVSPGVYDVFDTPEKFDYVLRQRNAIIYRNSSLYKNCNYQELPFLIKPITPEESGGHPEWYPDGAYSYIPNEPYEYNDDICTFAGDYACFREGYRIVINYNLKEEKNWQSVELYKNDVLFGSYLLTSDIGTYDRGPENYPAEKAALVPSHSFDLSFLNLTYGKYKARLKDGNGNYSDYTYFEVVDTQVSYSKKANGKTRINFSSSYGQPFYLRLSKSDGGPKCIYELTEEDITNGYCIIDVADIVKKQYNNLNQGDTVLKVYFKGEYGVVTNKPIGCSF